MAGFIYSQRQVEIYRLLERVGPCPLPALEILYGKKTFNALRYLRHAGYIYDITLNKVNFWSLQAYGRFEPGKQEVMAWFIARLMENNGRYLGEYECITPNGTRLRLQPQNGCMLVRYDDNRKMIAKLEELQVSNLSKC
ncbi:MAG TPA: hypothetical protein DD811_01740, partial [Syntrophomonas sp.]|nr:hypothetical protein [Syntrophomonas sp.]